VESALSTQKLKPTIDALKRLYGDDKDKVQRETSELYKKSGVNPTAGAAAPLPRRAHGREPHRRCGRAPAAPRECRCSALQCIVGGGSRSAAFAPYLIRPVSMSAKRSVPAD